MIDVNAVREGTRWTLDYRQVAVLTVSSDWVVFCEDHCPASVLPLDQFAAGARDPARADYEDILRELEKCARTPSGQQVPGVQECLLRDAVTHLLKRLGPPVPLNVVPPAPAKPEPVTLPAEPDPEPEAYAASALADDCVAEPETKPKRRHREIVDGTGRWV